MGNFALSQVVNFGLSQRGGAVQLAIACRQISIGCFDEEMGMGGQEAGGVAVPVAIIGDYPAGNMQKEAWIRAVEVYRAPGVPPRQHMGDSTGVLDSQSLCHVDVPIQPANSKSKT
jgi:hypothetical protein